MGVAVGEVVLFTWVEWLKDQGDLLLEAAPEAEAAVSSYHDDLEAEVLPAKP